LPPGGGALRSVVAALLSALAPPKHLRQEIDADLEDAELLAAAELPRAAGRAVDDDPWLAGIVGKCR
jgi:hypothetical protein